MNEQHNALRQEDFAPSQFDNPQARRSDIWALRAEMAAMLAKIEKLTLVVISMKEASK